MRTLSECKPEEQANILAFISRTAGHGVPLRVALVRAERKYDVPKKALSSLWSSHCA